jgi:parvulin-like peptidyl-prolyl isomerase
VYDPAFTTAAFSNRMNEVGDVSEPSVGSFGIHIVKYQRDVPSGLIMTDAIYSQISEALLIQKETEVLDSALSGWMAEMSISYNDANIALATQEAHERISKEQSEDKSEAPLEAVPIESEGN